MNRSRALSLLICLALLFTLAIPTCAAQSQSISVSPINVMVGGNVFLPTDVDGNDVPVFVYNGTTYAPLRALAETYGLTVGYNAEKKLATVEGMPSADFAGSKGTGQVLTEPTTLTVSSINIEVNGSVFRPKDADGNPVSVFVYNGTTYAPLRALAEAYGLTVGYDSVKRLATVDFVSTDGVDFTELLEEVCAAREAQIKSPAGFDGYTDYLINDPAAKNLLTPSEVNALLNTKDTNVQIVSAEQAISDIDLLFRALHAGYGAYYYFGQEAYDQAEAEIMEWIKEQTTVSVSNLTDVLRKSLSFMVDAHAYVGYRIDRLEGIRYEYHYCTEQQYAKDEQGYFKLINGQRMDFAGFSDGRVTMEPTLLTDGKIVYSPVLFCPANQVSPTTIHLKNAAGDLCAESISWTRAKDVPMSDGTINYRFLKENGLAYINIDKYDRSRADEYYDAFVASAKQTKDCKAVIFDLRANGGGTGNPTDEWIRGFTGRLPEVQQALAHRYSVFKPSDEGGTYYEVEQMDNGKWLPNHIPVIVLVDDACGSSGEGSLAMLKTMDNVLVVGTNSAGFNLGGNVVDFCLPHTHINARIGTMLRFRYEVKNTDCIGYTPDVWCESSLALDAVLNLLANAGIVDAETAEAFGESVAANLPASADPVRPNASSSDSISLRVGKLYVKNGQGFGIGGGNHVATVYLNDVSTSDFTVTVADPSICAVQKLTDGTFTLSKVNPGRTRITVQCGSTVQTFGLEVLG